MHGCRRGKRSRGDTFCQRTAEALEPRLLLAAIGGKVFNDYDADGSVDVSEPGLAGWPVYLDLDDNGVRDTIAETVIPSLNVPMPIPDFGQTVSQLAVSGLA